MCATLDAGAIKSFSGIHLIIYYDDESEDLREPRAQSEPTRHHMFWDSMSCDNVPGLNPHGLVNALKHTGWRSVSTRGIFNGNEPLEEEAVKAAKDRGITLRDS